ncbi:NAD(P)/FAD-dependent oxidoreductase [Arthrobacter sp. N199823]|uniref:flavin monoamine oxidase family protein n=1 Tax=Arthrobacter sp. N199823 TaxID=2058895 RepID=UPI0028007048|nr:NAD(P)/FAD-dependent oxidoreductase [Arthrobacter sp. N199823]
MPESSSISMLLPDFPFSYDEFLRNPAGVGSVPEDQLGTEIAIVGAGAAGLLAGYQAIALGLKPVIYDAEGIGGRLRGVEVPGSGGLIADMGGMRFPKSSLAFWHFADLLGVESTPFPNPLTSASPGTTIDILGRTVRANTAADLPEVYQTVQEAWKACLGERASFDEMQEAIRSRDEETIKRLWNELVPRFDDTSFWAYLSTSEAFGRLPFEAKEAFGMIGFGSGGWDVSFPNAILEILRVVFVDAEEDHRRITGGAKTFTDLLWSQAPENPAHWPAGTSLASLHNGTPLGAVTHIKNTGNGVAITDASGTTREYSAAIVTAHKGLLSTKINTDESLFTPEVWMAMRRTHYLQSSKTFIAVDRPFWNDTDPETGLNAMSTTLTDRVTRGTYLFDNGPGRPGLICLSYTWNDDSLQWAPLSAEERADIAIRNLEEIYPGLDLRSHVIGSPVAVSWENEPNYAGAFKINLPGHYRYQRSLYSHFIEASPEDGPQRVFLAGDDVSWTAGWIEGAVTTALNAIWGVQRTLGGSSHSQNPGPGERWNDLMPVVLP